MIVYFRYQGQCQVMYREGSGNPCSWDQGQQKNSNFWTSKESNSNNWRGYTIRANNTYEKEYYYQQGNNQYQPSFNQYKNYYPNNQPNNNSFRKSKNYDNYYQEDRGYDHTIQQFEESSYYYSQYNQDESLSKEDGIGVSNVGRYGDPNSKNAKKKKKKKKNKEVIPPPQPKTKQQSLVHQFAQECYQQQEEREVQMKVCPFNSSHIMPPSRLLTHIWRCRQTCQNAKYYRQCKYNSQHWIRLDKIEAHEGECLEMKKYKEHIEWQPSPFDPIEIKEQVSEIHSQPIISLQKEGAKPKSVKSEPKKDYQQRLVEDF